VVPPIGTRGLCRTRAQVRNRRRHLPVVLSYGGEKTLVGPKRGVARRISHLSYTQAFGSSHNAPVL